MNKEKNIKTMDIKEDCKLKMLSILRLSYKSYSKYKLNLIELISGGR